MRHNARRNFLFIFSLLAVSLALIGNLRANPHAVEVAMDAGTFSGVQSAAGQSGFAAAHPGAADLVSLTATPTTLQALGALAAHLPQGAAITSESLAAAFAAAQGQAVAEFDAKVTAAARSAAQTGTADALEAAARDLKAYSVYGAVASARVHALASAARQAKAEGKAKAIADRLLASFNKPGSLETGSGTAVSAVTGAIIGPDLTAEAAVAMINAAQKKVVIDQRYSDFEIPGVHEALERARARGVEVVTKSSVLAKTAASRSDLPAGVSVAHLSDGEPLGAPAAGQTRRERRQERVAKHAAVDAATQQGHMLGDVKPAGETTSRSITTRLLLGASAIFGAGVLNLTAAGQALASSGGSYDGGDVMLFLFLGVGGLVALFFVLRGLFGGSSSDSSRTDDAPRPQEPAARPSAPRPIQARPATSRPSAPTPAAPVARRPEPVKRPAAVPDAGVRLPNASALKKGELRSWMAGDDNRKATAALREVFNRKVDGQFTSEIADLLGNRPENIVLSALRLQAIQSLGDHRPEGAEARAVSKALLNMVQHGTAEEAILATKSLLKVGDKASIDALGERVEGEFVDRYQRGNAVEAHVTAGVFQHLEDLRRSGAKPTSTAYNRINKVLARQPSSPDALRASQLQREVYSRNPRYVPSDYDRRRYDDTDDFWTAYWVSYQMGIPYPSNYGLMFYYMHQMNAANAQHAPTFWEIQRDTYQDYSNRNLGTGGSYSNTAPTEYGFPNEVPPSNNGGMVSGNSASSWGDAREVAPPAASTLLSPAASDGARAANSFSSWDDTPAQGIISAPSDSGRASEPAERSAPVDRDTSAADRAADRRAAEQDARDADRFSTPTRDTTREPDSRPAPRNSDRDDSGSGREDTSR